ncbi:unnamed protein product [Symbiodinium sp. CCMP2592]|nr:unnamed protein product [Symbiodinium sp. CCMP2592]
MQADFNLDFVSWPAAGDDSLWTKKQWGFFWSGLWLSVVALVYSCAELSSLIVHLVYARCKRYRRDFPAQDQETGDGVMLRLKEVCYWVAAAVCLLLIVLVLTVLEQWLYYSRFHASMGFESMVLVSQVLYGVVHIPFGVPPHLATILLMQFDLEHLGSTREQVARRETCTEDSILDFKEAIAGVERRWRCFLRLHVAIDSLMPLMYIITVIIVLLPNQDLERPFAQFVLVWSIGAPLAMAYLWLQVLSLARFNKQIFEWALSTRDNDVYRALQQNQEGMTFSVFGFTITLQRIRVTVISFVVGVLLKFVTQMVMDAAKKTKLSVWGFRVQLFISPMFGLRTLNAWCLLPLWINSWVGQPLAQSDMPEGTGPLRSYTTVNPVVLTVITNGSKSDSSKQAIRSPKDYRCFVRQVPYLDCAAEEHTVLVKGDVSDQHHDIHHGHSHHDQPNPPHRRLHLFIISNTVYLS